MTPAVSILVSTFERPCHLQRVLASIHAQQGVDGQIEVVVTDDGSRDETPEVVARFAESSVIPIRFVTHEHSGFRLAQCRNEGVAASTAPYLLFLDGDCLIPPDHVFKHLQRRRPGVAIGSFCISLTQKESARIDTRTINSGSFVRLGSWREHVSLLNLGLKSHFYSWIRHHSKPKLFGGNIGISRIDYERVNGYDERFQGWGCEDDDLRIRLRMAGIRIETILPWTRTYHLWHPPTKTKPRNWRDGHNVGTLQQKTKLSRCLAGLKKRQRSDVAVRVSGDELLGTQIRHADDRSAGFSDRLETVISDGTPVESISL